MTSRRHRRRALFAVIMTATTFIAACNALNGAHDRVLDDGDTAVGRGRETGADTAMDEHLEKTEGGDEPKTDGPITADITVAKTFTTINGATILTTGTGTSITAYDGGATHPIIVPIPQPATPADDYTVYATVRAPNDGEFGVVVRIQPGGTGGYVVGSKFGGEAKIFLGSLTPPDWNPSLDSKSPTAWAFVAGHLYKFIVQVVGTQVSAKMWDSTLTEPSTFQVVSSAPWKTGREIGYYTYLINGAIIESMRVTVP